jgi:hypothetical protein
LVVPTAASSAQLSGGKFGTARFVIGGLPPGLKEGLSMRGFVLLALLVGSAGAAWGGVPLIDDDFTNAPCCTRAEYDAGTCDLDWVCQGSAVWISPDADECDLDLDDDGNVDANVFDQFVSFDPSNPCSQYPGEGYVLVTPAITNQIGNMFRKERILYDNFKLTAEVELRDGSIGRPADGMCIVIIGTDDVPPIGAGGGAMGSTGMGVAPTMISSSTTGAATRATTTIRTTCSSPGLRTDSTRGCDSDHALAAVLRASSRKWMRPPTRSTTGSRLPPSRTASCSRSSFRAARSPAS